jgi:hypothetical protein
VAELLVVSERLHAIDRDAPATIMSTSHLQAAVASSPAVRRQGEARAAVDIRRLVLAWEPALAGRTLLLDVVKGPRGQRDLVGSMRLGDGAWLNFRSPDVASGWAVALRATIMTLLATVLCVGAGLYALRALMRPLAQLARAADAMAHGQRRAARKRTGGTARSCPLAQRRTGPHIGAGNRSGQVVRGDQPRSAHPAQPAEDRVRFRR